MGKKVENVTILGGGNGAFCAGADLTLRGFNVTIYEDPRFKQNVEGLIANDNVINLTGPGPVGAAKIKKVTCDLADAVKDADIVMPISPAFAQESVAKTLVPILKDAEEPIVIFLCPGSCGGSLVYGKVFHEAGVYDKALLCEVNTLPYATRKVDAHTVRMILRDPEIFFAAFPSKNGPELFEMVKPMFDSVVLFDDVLETALNNGNIDSHATPVVLNAGKIEYYGKHAHYREGITPSVARVNDKVNQERMAVCEALGYQKIDIRERLERTGYCKACESLYDTYQTSKDIFMTIEGPNKLSERYLTEDAPCSLVFVANLAHAIGVDTPIMDSVTNLASALMDQDYWVTGRTLDKVGLDGKNKEEILKFVKEGY